MQPYSPIIVTVLLCMLCVHVGECVSFFSSAATSLHLPSLPLSLFLGRDDKDYAMYVDTGYTGPVEAG